MMEGEAFHTVMRASVCVSETLTNKLDRRGLSLLENHLTVAKQQANFDLLKGQEGSQQEGKREDRRCRRMRRRSIPNQINGEKWGTLTVEG